MISLRKPIFKLIIVMSCFVSNKAFSQCVQPAWSYCVGCYVAGDIVSYSGQDWVLGSTGQGFRTPGSLTGPNYWVANSGACQSSSAPNVSATEVRATYCTTSFGIGTITSDGGETITARGFVFDLSSNPTLTSAAVLVDAGTGVGDEFEGLMEDLAPETTYYIRTYATNSKGTTYGTETSFTTRATSDCVSDCYLACDMTDASLLNPDSASFPSIIAPGDTVCLTQNLSIGKSVQLRGMLKLCNGAQLSFSNSLDVQNHNSNTSFKGQVVYENCSELLVGNGNYQGELITGTVNDYDPTQMISYCVTCDENDDTQFFDNDVDVHLWAATCRPTSTLATPLPVELTKFTAKIHNEGVVLNWTTNSEINNSHFEVELSYDGINWYTIGIVQGSGNSAEINNYQFIDNQAGSGVHYYRLKQVDFNGTEAYSNVKYLSFDEASKPKSFVAYQNQNNKIEIQAIFNGMGDAFLIDTRGRVIEHLTFISTEKRGLELEFQTTNLSEGVYFVKIKSGNALLGQKVQIIK